MLPTLAVPRDWTRNRPIRMPIEIGMTSGCSPDWTMVRPSTAERTEIAGRDHRVAVEQAGREHAEHDQRRRPLLVPEVARDQRQQARTSRLRRLIVGAHRDEHIFDRHDQHQRPEDEAQHAEDVQPVDRQRMRAEEAFLHRVERRRADIAIDDADRAEHQLRQRFLGAVTCGGIIVRAGSGVGDGGRHAARMCVRRA